MSEQPLLSLCIATNGISEWVFPVLDSIYSQNVSSEVFEVVVTDNGHNDEFYSSMQQYKVHHSNLVYERNKAYLFENQIEALRLAKGEFLKFVNHRSVMEPESISWLINIIHDNRASKPVMYFSNGALGLKKPFNGDFNCFVQNLRQYASWTTGVGVWKEDFEKIPRDHIYNKISPHSDVLFSERNKSLYIIDDKHWTSEIDTNHSKKGSYDLYKAFGVEELTITLSLYVDGDITADTLKFVKKCYEDFLVECYLSFSILKRPCSYDISGFEDVMGIFYDKRRIKRKALVLLLKKIIGKVK